MRATTPSHASAVAACPRGAGQTRARIALVAFLIAAMLAVSGCERFRVYGSGGSNSEPDIGVGVEF